MEHKKNSHLKPWGHKKTSPQTLEYKKTSPQTMEHKKTSHQQNPLKGYRLSELNFFILLKVANIRCFIRIAVEIFHNIMHK
jgi:hypothetical protein